MSNITHLDFGNKVKSSTPPENGAPVIHHMPTYYVVDAACDYAEQKAYEEMLTLLKAVVATHDSEGFTALNDHQFTLFKEAD